jgi:hypothetical protein
LTENRRLLNKGYVAWGDISCTENAADRRRPARQNYASAVVALNVSPAMGLPLKMIALALADAGHIKRGLPTKEAESAMQWLTNNSFELGSFRWACHWLNLDPDQVRANGLPRGSNVVHQYRGGIGLDEIRNRWQQARARAQRGGHGSLSLRSSW